MSGNKVAFLYEASKVLPTSENCTFLRSHMIDKCHNSAVQLPAQNFKASVMCQACGVQLTDCVPRVSLGKRPKPSSRIKKLMKKEREQTILTEKQKKMLVCFRKRDYQSLVTICQLCKKKHVEKIAAVKFEYKTKKQPDIIPATPKKNKKRKKNRFAGLNENAVLSVQKKCQNVNETMIDLTDSPQKKSLGLEIAILDLTDDMEFIDLDEPPSVEILKSSMKQTSNSVETLDLPMKKAPNPVEILDSPMKKIPNSLEVLDSPIEYPPVNMKVPERQRSKREKKKDPFGQLAGSSKVGKKKKTSGSKKGTGQKMQASGNSIGAAKKVEAKKKQMLSSMRKMNDVIKRLAAVQAEEESSRESAVPWWLK